MNHKSEISIILIFIPILLFLAFMTNGQPIMDNKIIIDTDCAADDLRAICLFLAEKECSVAAVTTSDGALKPITGYIKVRALLEYFNLPDIPVAAGRELPGNNPPNRELSKNIEWGKKEKTEAKGSMASQLIASILEKAVNPVTLVCLGPLTNINDLLKSNPPAIKKIRKIIWYNETISPLSGTNYYTDTVSARYVLSASILVDVIDSKESESDNFDIDYLTLIGGIKTPYGERIFRSMNNSRLINAMESGHLKLWDDLVPVYFLFPEIFDMITDVHNPYHIISKDYNCEEVKKKILQILAREYSLEKNICFDRIPDDPEFYKYDLRNIVKSNIEKYGIEEWKACVLTNEIHGHLGIYSVIGGKMGIRARELLNADIDRIKVISYAGKDQPLSCMNDGLQAGTGGTIGLDMIEIADVGPACPEAVFYYKEKTVRLKLKDDLNNQIKKDIEEGIVQYGNLTSGYWKLVRKLSIRYWSEWDRNDIFEIK